MRQGANSPSLFPLLGLGATLTLTALPSTDGSAQASCQGRRLLSTPRPEGTCQNVRPEIYASPDGELQALVLPAGVSLYATPDIESRVVLPSRNGDTLTSKDYSSPRGTNGYHVLRAQWSPDSQFFVFSMASSGGHSPWSFPTMAYGREKNVIAKVSDMIDGRPVLSGDFSLAAPHRLAVKTWRQPGELDNPATATIDLAAAFAKLPPEAD